MSRQVLHLLSAKIPFYETILAKLLQYLHLRGYLAFNEKAGVATDQRFTSNNCKYLLDFI